MIVNGEVVSNFSSCHELRLVDGSKYGNNIMATVADRDDDDDDVYYGQILWISLLYRTFVWNK